MPLRRVAARVLATLQQPFRRPVAVPVRDAAGETARVRTVLATLAAQRQSQQGAAGGRDETCVLCLEPRVRGPAHRSTGSDRHLCHTCFAVR